MKTILFVVYLTFGPGVAANQPPLIISVEEDSEQSCLAQVERYQRGGYSHGRTGNLPGYRYVFAAWCEDRDEPWEGSTVQPGPYYPKDKAERDKWTPLWTPWGGHKP
jgi:hypothetical protein